MKSFVRARLMILAAQVTPKWIQPDSLLASVTDQDRGGRTDASKLKAIDPVNSTQR